MRRGFHVVGAALAVGLISARAQDRAPATIGLDEPGVLVVADARGTPGVHFLKDPSGRKLEGAIRIATDGVTLDLAGSELVGSGVGPEPDAFPCVDPGHARPDAGSRPLDRNTEKNR